MVETIIKVKDSHVSEKKNSSVEIISYNREYLHLRNIKFILFSFIYCSRQRRSVARADEARQSGERDDGGGGHGGCWR
jgi:hypothetical protein